MCTHWISLFWQSKVESYVYNKLLSPSLLFQQLCTFWEAFLPQSWQGQLPAHLMSAWRSRIMVRHGTVVIPVNRMAEGGGKAPVKLPFFCSRSRIIVLSHLLPWPLRLSFNGLSLRVPSSANLIFLTSLNNFFSILYFFFKFTSFLCRTKPWKLLIFFFFFWIESNKDPFFFDVIKLLRLDLGVRVNFFPEHREELSEDFRCQALLQASWHLVFFASTSHKR